MKKLEIFFLVSLLAYMAGSIASTAIMRTRTEALLNKAKNLDSKITHLEEKLTGRCEPSLEYEKRCTRIQYLYKNGYFRGVKCLRWED